ncbi:MAG: aminotransferase class IV [Phycisphaerae bacterium]|jgi:branched-chain amino acid aminotransferase|nr:aminotransferase class IV [Phycisphaerae bacterium]
MDVWLNGTWLDRHEAKVSVFDAGFQHAVGLFETMVARNGRVFRVRDHLERLRRSAVELRLTESLHIEPLAEAVQSVIERNALREARVRLTVTGGDLNLLQSSGERSTHEPTILIVAQPPTRYPEDLFTKGVRVMVADGRVNPLDRLAGHKSLSYWSRLAALQQAGAVGASEAVWFSVTNHLASGCVSNIFLVRDGVVLTPYAHGEEAKSSLPAPVLPGITRSVMLELIESGLQGQQGEGLDLRAERTMLSIEDVFAAEEIFLTNSSWGVLPVIAIERTQIGQGTPGPVAAALRAAWRERVERETSALG